MFILLSNIKGIVHPKMKMLSLFTHRQGFLNLYECYIILFPYFGVQCTLRKKGTKAVTGAVPFHFCPF